MCELSLVCRVVLLPKSFRLRCPLKALCPWHVATAALAMFFQCLCMSWCKIVEKYRISKAHRLCHIRNKGNPFIFIRITGCQNLLIPYSYNPNSHGKDIKLQSQRSGAVSLRSHSLWPLCWLHCTLVFRTKICLLLWDCFSWILLLLLFFLSCTKVRGSERKSSMVLETAVLSVITGKHQIPRPSALKGSVEVPSTTNTGHFQTHRCAV